MLANNMRFSSAWLLCLVVLMPLASPLPAGVENTVHNLAARAVTANGRSANPCEFCHTPHNANPTKSLWNRTLPANTYKVYESSTLKATLNQPTGTSRMCLSCHDGTIALDDRADRPKGAKVEVLTGSVSLGTDLSDDHPISFIYNPALSAAKGELVDPSLLPSSTRLDQAGQVQCSTCHDPHEDRNPKFLVMDNRSSRLCLTCHQINGWTSSAHALSSATWNGSGINPWAQSGFKTVAENGCANCHATHSAGRPQWLLQFGKEAKNCLVCHNGTTAAKDVEREFRKFSAHPVEQAEWVHNPKENPRLMERHVSCGDCHSPHGVQSAPPESTSLLGSMQGVKGVNASGTVVTQASFQYEVCYSCHGLKEELRAPVVRMDHVANTRLEFDPSNASYHPVVAPSRNPLLSGFQPGFAPSKLILCTDCHSGDNSSRVNGPHGSSYEPILERPYQLQDPAPESYQAYALCYKCHSRTTIFSGPNGFPHQQHVVELQTPCATCHDAHGSRSSTYLINFMVRGKTGNTVVSPSSSGRLEFQDLGAGQGQCYLSCHGSDHDPKRYPASKQPTHRTTLTPQSDWRRR
jgi:predicted CXXCH cytochrome family protein